MRLVCSCFEASPFYIFINAFIISIFWAVLLPAQTMKNSSDRSLDFSAVEAYFMLTDKMKQNIEPTDKEWHMFFEAPINSIMIYVGALDTTKFKNDLRNTYLTPDTPLEQIDDKALQHHYKYKSHEKDLREHIHFLKSSNVLDSIQKYLSPYLPARLCLKENIPRQHYIFYGSEDATGGSDMVINDLLLSYKIDNYRLGLLSAHEAFHSIVSKSFADMILNQSNENNSNIDLLYFLSNISQEGVADLIDKPLLVKTQSPLKKETELLFEDEVILTAKYIRKLDSLLKNTEGNFTHNFSSLFQNFSKNGGHIPGRVMGITINNCGMLPALLPRIEDPILFMELYNKAVQNCELALPCFSRESLTYLDKLKQRYLKKQ